MTATDFNRYPDRPSARGIVRISEETLRLLIFALWCSVTFIQFRFDELILYPLALYYAWSILRNNAAILALLVRSWVLLLFPVWCVLSVLWAEEPSIALKQSAYLMLTIMICYHVAATMSPRRILQALFLAVGVIGVINTLYGFGTGDLKTGIFVQKNAMGKNMVVLWIVSICVLLDRGSPAMIRVAGLIMAGNAALMAYLSESATAVLLVAATAGIILVSTALLLGGFMRLSRVSGLCFSLATAFLVAAVLVSTVQENPVDGVLNAFGKDTSLTGRTLLWTYAEEQIRERPLLGVGAGGFWQYADSPLVQKIHMEFHKGPRDTFNFHNAFFEIAVHQGLIGLFFAVSSLVWAFWVNMRGAFLFGTLPQVYFFAHSFAVLTRTMTEGDFLKPFTLIHMVLWIGALSVVRLHQQRQNTRRAATPT